MSKKQKKATIDHLTIYVLLSLSIQGFAPHPTAKPWDGGRERIPQDQDYSETSRSEGTEIAQQFLCVSGSKQEKEKAYGSQNHPKQKGSGATDPF